MSGARVQNPVPDVEHHVSLDDYAAVPHLAQAVADLRAEAARTLPALAGRTIWMINSTRQGGGVAEMLPAMISLLRGLGFAAHWLVIDSDRPEFFALTKRIHNLIHDVDEPHPDAADRELFDAVSRENAAALRHLVGPRDIVVVHDPQPIGTGALLAEEIGMPLVWRCHIGIDRRTPATGAAWRFLEPYTPRYARAVFTTSSYIPSYFTTRSVVIHPAIDPLSHKNRDLSLHKLVGVLCDSSLVPAYGPLLRPLFDDVALRLHDDGEWVPAAQNDEIGLLFRPIVCQISRWDRLKGFGPLLDGFCELKRSLSSGDGRAPHHRRAVEIARLVLAGPAPGAVADDPEAPAVLAQLTEAWLALDAALRRDIALIKLPMSVPKQNALMVNALQRSASIVAQNSLQEGFGLTVTEAMFKRIAVMGTQACGLREQIRDGLDGRLVADAEDPRAIAAVLDELLGDEAGRDRMAGRAERRAHDDFLIFGQLRRWLTLLRELTDLPKGIA